MESDSTHCVKRARETVARALGRRALATAGGSALTHAALEVVEALGRYARACGEAHLPRTEYAARQLARSIRRDEVARRAARVAGGGTL